MQQVLKQKLEKAIEESINRLVDYISDPPKKLQPDKLALLTERLIKILNSLPKQENNNEDKSKFLTLIDILEQTDPKIAEAVVKATERLK